MKPNETNSKSETPRTPTPVAGPKTREERGTEPKLPELDFAKLDLTVEVVEERISPGETNVFDK